MILSRRVSYCGQELDELDDAIVISGVEVGAPKENISAVDRMGFIGQRVTGSHWQTLEVSVSFSIKLSKRDLSGRRKVYDKVAEWAMQSGNGKLRINYINSRYLQVDKVIIQDRGDMRNWTEPYKITFRAYNIPFWQDQTSEDWYIGGKTGSAQVIAPGHVRTVAEVKFTNRSGAVINQASVEIRDQSNNRTGLLKFAHLDMKNDETLVIGHTRRGILDVKIGSRSIYDMIDTSSTDDLFIDPGLNLVSVSADRYGDWHIEVFGRYM